MNSILLKNYWFVARYSCHFLWSDFNQILENRTQQDELEHLKRWAHRKRLKTVGAHYERLLLEVETRLSKQARLRPRLYELTE